MCDRYLPGFRKTFSYLEFKIEIARNFLVSTVGSLTVLFFALFVTNKLLVFISGKAI